LRRSPLAVLAFLVSGVIYLLVREVGHFVALALLGLPIFATLRYRFLPAVEVGAGILSIPVGSAAWIIASAPLATLGLGYVLLVLIARRGLRGGRFLGTIGAFTCYLTLTLDPIYYAAIPLFSPGGEPEKLAYLLGISTGRLEIPALLVLALNIVVARRVVVPRLRAISGDTSGT
jgi:hypothetical protein